jgi:formamidopyrimidine-DNA glycosylase
VLLDQRVVAGVGNIYALEALFEAGIHPLVRAYRLRESAWNRLATAVRSVLRQGIENGGTTFRDFRGATGKAGNNRAALAVYGRRGEACRRCGTALEGFSVGGRSGVFCPNDQARPRGVVR